MSVYPGSIDSDATLYVSADQVQTRLSSAMLISDTVMVVASPTGWVANMIATVGSEQMLTGTPVGNVIPVTRAYAGTSAAAHASGSLVSNFVDSIYQRSLKQAVIAIETALGPNLSNIAGAYPIFDTFAFDFSPQTPGGSLIVGNNSITMAPVPEGVNGTDSDHYLWVSNGTGTAEACLITGGTGQSGDASGQIIINCAHTHTGGWTIESDTGGIAESIQANGAGTHFVKARTIDIGGLHGLVVNTANVTILGSGWGSILKARDGMLMNQCVRTNSGAVGFKFLHMCTDGNGSNSGTNQTSGVGVSLLSYYSEVSGCELRNAQHGGVATGSVIGFLATNNWIHDNINSLVNGFSFGIQVLGASTDVRIIGNRIENNYPVSATTGGGAACALDAFAVNIIGNYFKNNYNVGGQVVDNGTNGITRNWNIIGNQFIVAGDIMSTSGIEFTGAVINISGNYFNGGLGAGVVIEPQGSNAGLANISDNTFIDLEDGVVLAADGGGGICYENIITSNIFGALTRGIFVAATAVLTIIADNILRDSVTTPISNASSSTFSSTNIVNGNIPYQQGPTAITVGASPFTYTAGMAMEVIYIRGGTVSVVSIGGITLATASPAQVTLDPNQSLVVTYSVLPTMISVIY